jgi:hypothetical protein
MAYRNLASFLIFPRVAQTLNLPRPRLISALFLLGSPCSIPALRELADHRISNAFWPSNQRFGIAPDLTARSRCSREIVKRLARPPRRPNEFAPGLETLQLRWC